MGRFENYVPITSGMTLVVYELGGNLGGTDEYFSVYLATGFDCADSVDNDATLEILATQAVTHARAGADMLAELSMTKQTCVEINCRC